MAPDPKQVCHHLLPWYDREGRTLPWRGGSDCYRIWVSEIMLQQTRVDTALRYFEPFLERFPTLRSLAESDEEEVLAAWSGLGFYRRARNLHRGAREIVERFDGVFPTDPDELGSLPGVGRYTVGAILSSALNARLPILDGNVIRVLSRLFMVDGDPGRAVVQRRLWQLAEEVLPHDRPGDFNQALMDLGATVCKPTGPGCDRCPLASLCSSRGAGCAEDYPKPGRKTRVRFEERVSVLLERDDGRFLLRKRPPEGLLASLWELPSADVDDPAQVEMLASSLAGDGIEVALCGTVEHRFSHRHWTVRVFRAHLGADDRLTGIRGAATDQRWVLPADLHELGLPTAVTKALRLALGSSGKRA